MRWQVASVMTRDVVTATTDTPVGRIADLLATHRISAVPIVGDDDRVLGVVSEADLLAKVADGEARARKDPRGTGAAGELMSTRPVTITADAPLPAAAHKMQANKVRRLLVTDGDGRLMGVVSRTDVLRPLTRPDESIRHDIVERVLRRKLWIGPDQVHVDVDGGVVTLSGDVDRRTTADITVRLTKKIPGVVAVRDQLRYGFDDTALARSRVNRTHPFSAEPFHPN